MSTTRTTPPSVLTARRGAAPSAWLHIALLGACFATFRAARGVNRSPGASFSDDRRSASPFVCCRVGGGGFGHCFARVSSLLRSRSLCVRWGCGKRSGGRARGRISSESLYRVTSSAEVSSHSVGELGGAAGGDGGGGAAATLLFRDVRFLPCPSLPWTERRR